MIVATSDSISGPPLDVLISGASFAGLATAFWMVSFGHRVTVVEIGDALKRGGTPVDIREGTIDVVKRMGLYEQIRANRLVMGGVEYKDASDATVGRMSSGEESEGKSFEIERDVLLDILFNELSHDVEFRFSNTIKAMTEDDDGVRVEFDNGLPQTFDLVIGCDGIHSAVRRLWFGEEREFSHFLKAYFSIAIARELLIPENTTHLYNETGKTLMLNAYNGKTDIVFCFASEEEIAYDYRNANEQSAIAAERIEGVGWRASELRDRLLKAEDFYLDMFCQVKMPSWSKGRVALVGDAAYCASPAAGMGGSLALHGAAALGEAIKEAPADFEAAFAIYDHSFRPFVEQIQERAVEFIGEFLHRSEEAISETREQES